MNTDPVKNRSWHLDQKNQAPGAQLKYENMKIPRFKAEVKNYIFKFGQEKLKKQDPESADRDMSLRKIFLSIFLWFYK